MAEQYGVQFDLLNETQKDYLRALAAGLADADTTSITKIYHK